MNILRSFILFTIIGLMGLNALAQKKELKLSDAYTNPEVYPVRISQLQWIPSSSDYSFVEDGKLKKTSVKGKESILLEIATLSADFEKAGFKATKRFPRLQWVSSSTLSFVKADTLYEYSISEHSIKNICYYPTASDVIKYEKNHKQTAFTRDNNLYIFANGKETAVTSEKDPNIVSGQTVSRSEYGITHGIFWSPKGNLLAFYQKDESNVTDYPLVDIDARVAEVKNTKYPMAGMKTEVVKLHVYNPTTQKTVVLDTDDKMYLTNISWSPDEKYVFIQVLNRASNHMWLNKYDASSGKLVKTLLEETNDRWVEPQNQLHFLNGSNTQFVYLSQQDGYMHAYLYDIEGKLIKQLTKGDWIITDYLGFDAKNTKLYFMATKDSPIERHLYSVKVKDGGISKLTDTHGTHSVTLNDSKQYFTDILSNNTDIAREYRLYSSKGKMLKVLKENRSPLKEFNVGETIISTLKADDGTDLYYRLIKPANFDSTKKYPVLVYVYGGPHVQMISDSWMGGSGFFLQYMASKGYVVFTLDNRGSGNRGFKFESIIHAQLGVTEMKDQMVGVEYLKSLSYVDTARFGVDGWSFGGFMATSLMTHHAETFKVGVAGGPVIDWKYYEIMYGERYMDTPEQNAEGYKNSNLLNNVDKLEGRLMLIHGTMDPTVVWQHSLKFIQECVKQQKQVDYFVYPGHGHNVRGMDRLHLETKIARYFDDFL
ncbi:MAG: DPP IV N-terminal domain-containing protein [Bacteroidales bacterium]|nr:DPP IV N-terminal domain-containing protein [Bacteroidales bacterium]